MKLIKKKSFERLKKKDLQRFSGPGVATHTVMSQRVGIASFISVCLVLIQCFTSTDVNLNRPPMGLKTGWDFDGREAGLRASEGLALMMKLRRDLKICDKNT